MTLSIEGFVTATPSASAQITTAHAGDIIICYVNSATSNGTCTGVSDGAALTWNLAASNTAQGTNSYVFWAYSPAALTNDTITAAGANASGFRVTAFGIIGANTTTPLDPNVSLPAYNSGAGITSLGVTVSTSNANDMLLNFLRAPSSMGTVTRPTGFSSVGNTGTATDISSNVVSSTLSSVTETFNWTTSNTVQTIFLAIQAAASSITGTAAVTEQNDSDSSSGLLTITGTVAKTEQSDSSAAAGLEIITGTLVTTEQSDSSASSGAETITGTLAKTELNDSSASTALLTITGTASPAEQNDSSASTGTQTITGSLSITEQSDSTVSAGSLTVNSTASPIEQNDSSAATAIENFTSSLAITEQSDTSAGSASQTIIGTASAIEGNDSVTSTAVQAVIASANMTEQGDGTSSEAIVAFISTGSPVEQSDSAVASGTTSQNAFGTGAPVEEDDTSRATGVTGSKATQVRYLDGYLDDVYLDVIIGFKGEILP